MTKKITKLMLNGQEYEIREYQGGGWQPGANTMLYLPLSDDINDHSINQRIMATSGTVTKGTIGYIFGSNGRSSIYSTNFAGPEYGTISVWIKQTSRQDDACIASHFAPGSPYHYQCLKMGNPPDNNKITAEYSTTSGANPHSIMGNTLNLNTWYNLVMVYDTNGAKLYINGTPVVTASNSGTLLTTSTYFVVGDIYGLSFFQYFIGEVSEVIYESGGWSAQEVLDYYNQTKDQYQSSEPQTEPCHICGGTGEEECIMCGGTGQEMCYTCSGTGQIGDPEDPEGGIECPDCGGTGFISCGICDGTGMVTCSNCGGTGEEPGE